MASKDYNTADSVVSLQQFVARVAKERGLDFRGYKPSTLERRVQRRMAQLHLADYRSYLELLQRDGAELGNLLNAVLINVTEFFRDPAAWDTLREEVLREQLAALPHGGSFRAWTAGCATGEETYSLAILIADHFGARLRDYDIKIYATDIDEEALAVARKGEYPADRLRRVRPGWVAKYLIGKDVLRVVRDVRRLVIFGSSNLISDAPISHVNLLVCRNVLIYFDTATQRHILARMHYALEPEGVLFLGKSESRLTNSQSFSRVSARWRIFRKIASAGMEETVRSKNKAAKVPAAGDEKTQLLLRTQQSLLDTLNSGVILLDDEDQVVAMNDAAPTMWGLAATRAQGKRLGDTAFATRCPELLDRLRQTKNGQNPVAFQTRCKVDGSERLLNVTVRSVFGESGERSGTLIHADDGTAHDQLQKTVDQLESTSQELQSANEELETTNEELQSTNEELETTNEELQSTNEELETTNEELQSLNEELETMNSELERRSSEVNQLNSRYSETLHQMPWPVVLVDREEHIQIWNSAAQRIFGIGPSSVVGLELGKLPVLETLRDELRRKVRQCLREKGSSMSPGVGFATPGFPAAFDLYFTYMEGSDRYPATVMITFGPQSSQSGRQPGQSAGQGKVGTGEMKKSKSARNPRSKNSRKKRR